MGRRLGQHFLARKSILDRIASAACPERSPLVIEIGPGKGALTESLLERADRVIAIEIDTFFVHYLNQKFRSAVEQGSLTIVEGDVLKTDLTAWGEPVIAGNLPYYITSPILQKVFELETAAAEGGTSIGAEGNPSIGAEGNPSIGAEGNPSIAAEGGPSKWTRAVFLVQAEVAERIAASPGSRDFGYLSVQTQVMSRPEILFPVSRSAFRPPPKVDSAVVRLEPQVTPGLGAEERKEFLRFASACFRQKRKTLRNNLTPVFGNAIESLPEARLRAEQLSVAQLIELFRKVRGTAGPADDRPAASHLPNRESTL